MISSSDSRPASDVAGSHVLEVVRSAERELRELLRIKADLVQRIGTLKQTLFGLASVFGESVLNPELLALLDRKASQRQPGFTHACRLVLMQSHAPLTTNDICSELGRRFPDLLQRHKDPTAFVTTVLNRLVHYGEVRSSWNSLQRRVWEWTADSRLQPGIANSSSLLPDREHDSRRHTKLFPADPRIASEL
jgi:hypothetical protein